MDLHALLCQERLDSQAVIAFMHNVLRSERGPLFWFWDNAAIHTDATIATFRARYPRLRLCPFPTYAPELNPTESVWAKTDEQLASRLIYNTEQLMQQVSDALCRIRNSQTLLWSCVTGSDLPG